MRITVANAPAFRRAANAAGEQMRTSALDAVALVLGTALIEASETVPRDTGRLAGAYAQAAEALGVPGGDAAGAVPGDHSIAVDPQRGVEVTIATPYAVFIEEGTSRTSPGYQVVTAMENARNRLIFGRGPSSLRGQLAAGWRSRIAGGG